MSIRYDPRAPRRLREARGLSPKEAAKRARTTTQHIASIERGPLGPTAAVLARLATALEVHIAEFFVERAS